MPIVVALSVAEELMTATWSKSILVLISLTRLVQAMKSALENFALYNILTKSVLHRRRIMNYVSKMGQISRRASPLA